MNCPPLQKCYVISRYFSCMRLLMGFLFTYISVIFSKSSDYGLGGIMQRSLHMHAYRAHFFVLSMIFMQIPAVPYLCSQLPTGTKGLCKQLQQANRFHPLQKNHQLRCSPSVCKPFTKYFCCFFACFNRVLYTSLQILRVSWVK